MRTEQGDGPAIVDLSDAQCRRSLPLKWGSLDADVLPAWVAEMDYALAPVVREAVLAAVHDGITGYPPPDGRSGVGQALAGFAQRHWGWDVDPPSCVLVGDVMSGVRLALEVLSEPGPVVVPTPAYMPFLDVAQQTGRERVDLPLDPDQPHAAIDLERLDALLAAGARTVLLSQPHNPWGRAFTRPELEGLRDVVVRRGARVISDEIHAPLVLPGAQHVPYLSIEGTAGHAVGVLAASKAFNTAGLKCAQVVSSDPAAVTALRSVPLVQNHATSPLGAIAAAAAYEDGDAWLGALLERLGAQRALFGRLLPEHLPASRMRPLEATYLVWLDARGHGHPDPAAEALRHGRVAVSAGTDFGPGGDGHVRVNLATSPDRLREVVRRLEAAWRS